jgi:hypothetical protein
MEQNENKNPSLELTISDLNQIRMVLDLAFRRGAFLAGEATSVGTIFDKLNNFLNSVSPTNNSNKSSL